MPLIRIKRAGADHSPVCLLALCVSLALATALTGCASLASGLADPPASGSATVAAPQQKGTGLEKVHDPKKVTYSRTETSCQFRDGGQLPDRACTPGAIDPAVT